MTFEEFFVKKKIDLDALSKAEPDLFAEFRSHYNQMGEKSFDHTKKFWFNKLRRLYHLVTPEKAVTQLETKIASQAEPLSSPTIEQEPASPHGSSEPAKTSPKPAFRPRNIPAPKTEEKKEDTSLTENSEAPETPIKKPGFRPRNIKAVAQDAEDAKSLESRPGKTQVSDTPIVNSKSNEDTATSSQPANKPKFKMRNVPAKAEGAAEQAGDSIEGKPLAESDRGMGDESKPTEVTKQAYKPKFNLKNIAKAKTEHSDEIAEEKKAETPSVDNPAKPLESATAKPAYKPRFNMKNLPKAKSEEEEVQASEKDTLQEIPVQKEESELAEVKGGESVKDKPEVPVAKPAYKPRFNMKNLPKAKPEEEVVQGSESDLVQEAPSQKIESETAEAKIDEPLPDETGASKAKPAYKPSFNMKNIKPKPPGEAE